MIRRRSIKNRNVIYTGRVGAKMRPLAFRGWSRRVPMKLVECISGPWRGYKLCLDPFSGCETLPIVVRGVAGRYTGAGHWVAE